MLLLEPAPLQRALIAISGLLSVARGLLVVARQALQEFGVGRVAALLLGLACGGLWRGEGSRPVSSY